MVASELITIPAISLWQPYASALFALRPDGHPIKPDETRHWPLPQRMVGKVIAIHAAKRDSAEERAMWNKTVLTGPNREMLIRGFLALGIERWEDLPRGALVGTVVFDACRPTIGHFNTEKISRAWGKYGRDRFAWSTVQQNHFTSAIPYLGRQKFFTVELPSTAINKTVAKGPAT